MSPAPEIKKTLVIIPVYNEAPKIELVIQNIFLQGFSHVLVVDDGSQDNSVDQVKRTNASVIKHEKNHGVGAAIKTGIEWGLDRDFEYFLTIDGDDQHNPEDLIHIMDHMGEYDHVLGSRFLKTDNKIPYHRNLGNQIANTIVLFRGVRTTDSQSGICGFNRKVGTQVLKTKSRGFEFWTEFLLRIRRKQSHFLCSEIPVSVQYTKYSLKKGQGIWQGSWTLLKVFFV